MSCVQKSQNIEYLTSTESMFIVTSMMELYVRQRGRSRYS